MHLVVHGHDIDADVEGNDVDLVCQAFQELVIKLHAAGAQRVIRGGHKADDEGAAVLCQYAIRIGAQVETVYLRRRQPTLL